MTWQESDVPEQSGRTVVVTGANSGIGFETARILAERGATVVMACRSLERGEAAAERIRRSDPDGSVVLESLDLASLDSIREFAGSLDVDAGRSDGDAGIDVLVNNAGVMAIPRRETEDGFEMQLGVNHLGHFALTGLLFDRLADDARIVTVSSAVHQRGEIDFGNLQSTESYDRWDAYAQSKLANLLFAYELDRRLEGAGSDVVSVGVHPGYANTNLQSRGPEMDGSRVRLALMGVANAVFAQSATKGALPTLYAATEPDIDGGEYVGPDGLLNMRGYPVRQRSSEASYDREVARRLWERSEALTDVSYDWQALVTS